jgi:hypothetical protein
MTTYNAFLDRKSQGESLHGFAPTYCPDYLYDFQSHLVDWSLRKGRSAILADCGLGKTPMLLVWAQNVVEQTNKPVLVLTPLAVGRQTLAEAEKFSVDCERSRDGVLSGQSRVVVTNYEKLHLFSPSDFGGVVCDESSILKHFKGATQQSVTRFMAKIPYRLLCTATAAPNDYTELGTSAEALGELGMIDMLGRFFKPDDKPTHQLHRMKKGVDASTVGAAVAGTGGGWRLKGHAVTPFWRWVASWARACRRPEDLGFSGDAFVLPELIERDHIITPSRPKDGMLFDLPAIGFHEEREERRRTIRERCELVADLVNHDRPAVVWCHLNAEGDALVKAIDGARQVRGADSDEAKEEAYQDFASGALRVLVIKPKIGAWGLNWQHCNHVVTFASHSYEQYYQSVRRCWRFGQLHPVTVDVVYTEGEAGVRDNMHRKSQAADVMFSELVKHMNNAMHVSRLREGAATIEVPSWLS